MSDPISFESIKKQAIDDQNYEFFAKCCKGLNKSFSTIPSTPENVVQMRGCFAFAFGIVRALGELIETYDFNIQRAIEMNAVHKESSGEDSPSIVAFIDEFQRRNDVLKEILKESFSHMVAFEINTFEFERGVNDDDV